LYELTPTYADQTYSAADLLIDKQISLSITDAVQRTRPQCPIYDEMHAVIAPSNVVKNK